MQDIKVKSLTVKGSKNRARHAESHPALASEMLQLLTYFGASVKATCTATLLLPPG